MSDAHRGEQTGIGSPVCQSVRIRNIKIREESSENAA